MMTSVLVALLWMQGPYGYPQFSQQTVPGQPAFRPHLPADSLAPDSGDEHRQAAAKQRQFEYSFNRLLDTLRSFADTYNASGAVDTKKVKAIKKAWRELEASDPWFKLSKNR